ncbi:MAG: helix-turn-helix transcriptional regulator [Chitinophagaceae bacterium]
MLQQTGIKEVKISIGKLIRTLREREQLTQEQLAEQLALSRLTIQNLEAGKNPTIDTLLKVLQYFELLEGFGSYIASETANNSQQSLY